MISQVYSTTKEVTDYGFAVLLVHDDHYQYQNDLFWSSCTTSKCVSVLSPQVTLSSKSVVEGANTC